MREALPILSELHNMYPVDCTQVMYQGELIPAIERMVKIRTGMKHGTCHLLASIMGITFYIAHKHKRKRTCASGCEARSNPRPPEPGCPQAWLTRGYRTHRWAAEARSSMQTPQEPCQTQRRCQTAQMWHLQLKPIILRSILDRNSRFRLRWTWWHVWWFQQHMAQDAYVPQRI